MVRTIRIHSRRLMIEMKEISQFAFKIQTMYHELLSQSDISVGSLKVVVMKQTKSSKADMRSGFKMYRNLLARGNLHLQ